MNIKYLLIFLGCLIVGSATAFHLLGQLESAAEQKPPAAAVQNAPVQPKAQPEWMAPPVIQKEKDRVLKVGVIGPAQGDGAAFGNAVLNGVMMAAERFNAAGGIGGEKFQVLPFDNKGEDEMTRLIFSDLVRRNVIAIFTAPTGWSTFASTHLANNSKTITISVGSRRRIGFSGEYVFQFSLPDTLAIDDLLGVAADQLGYKDYALVTSSSYDYSLDISALFKQAVPKHGGTIHVDADTYDTFTGQNNIAAVVQALRKSPRPLQALIFTGGAEEAARLAGALREAGLKLPIIGHEDLFTDTFLKGGEAVRGSLIYATFSPHSRLPEVARFMECCAKDSDAHTARFTALAFDAFTFLAGAVKDAGSLNSAKVREALLSRAEQRGATGTTRMSADGFAIKHPFIYRIESDGDGEKFVLLHQQSRQKEK